MVKLTFGTYLSIDCYDNDSEEYIDSIPLSVQETEQLPKCIQFDTVGDGREVELSSEQVGLLKEYMKDDIPLDHERCSYTLCLCQEAWLSQQIREERRKSIPDPKSVFALEILEKGEEYGDGRIIPIFEINADDVRSYFDMPEPENFDFDDRLDDYLLTFIKQRVKCNNIDMEKYDYRPAIWENVFQRTDMTIVPCNID